MRRVLGIGAGLLLLLAVAGLAAAGENGNYSVHLNGDTEVPANASLAAGQAIFHLSPDGTSLDYKLIVANLDNPVAAHIHVGPPGVNGPVVAFLFGPAAPGWNRERRARGGHDHRGESRRAACRSAVLGARRCSELGQRVRQRPHERRRAPWPVRARVISRAARSAGTSRSGSTARS